MPSPLQLGATDEAEIDRCFERISNALVDPREHASFLFGAGMSIGAGLPSGRDLAQELIGLLLPNSQMPRDPSEIAQLLNTFPLESLASAAYLLPGAQGETLLKCLNRLYGNLKPPPRADLSAHNAFASLVGLNYVADIFTTNFDTLLEHCIGSRAIPTTQESGGDHEATSIPVYHLHGLLSDQSYRITEEHLYSYQHDIALAAFRSSLYRSQAFVFVGYSMSDPDLRNVFFQNHLELRDRFRNPNRTTYFVMPVSNSAEYVIAKDIWKCRGAQLIPMNAEMFFAKLKTTIESVDESSMRKAIMNHRSIDAATLEDLVEKTKALLNFDDSLDALRFLVDSIELDPA